MAYVNKDVQKKPNAAPAADVEPASKTAGMVKGASGIDEQIQMLSPGGKGGWNGDQGAEAQLGSVQMMSKASSGASKSGANPTKAPAAPGPANQGPAAPGAAGPAPQGPGAPGPGAAPAAAAPKATPAPTSPQSASRGASQGKKPS